MSFKWCRKAVALGHQEVFNGCEMLADWGNADDLFYLGHCYEVGKSVKPNEKNVLKWYKDAVLKGVIRLYPGMS